MRRLAAVSGSNRTALAFSLTGLTHATRPSRMSWTSSPASPLLTVWEICTTVADQHDSDASYAAIRATSEAAAMQGNPDHLSNGDEE